MPEDREGTIKIEHNLSTYDCQISSDSDFPEIFTLISAKKESSSKEVSSENFRLLARKLSTDKTALRSAVCTLYPEDVEQISRLTNEILERRSSLLAHIIYIGAVFLIIYLLPENSPYYKYFEYFGVFIALIGMALYAYLLPRIKDRINRFLLLDYYKNN